MAKPKTTERHVYFVTEQQAQFIQRTADDRGISASEMLRRILDQHIGRQPKLGRKELVL